MSNALLASHATRSFVPTVAILVQRLHRWLCPHTRASLTVCGSNRCDITTMYFQWHLDCTTSCSHSCHPFLPLPLPSPLARASFPFPLCAFSWNCKTCLRYNNDVGWTARTQCFTRQKASNNTDNNLTYTHTYTHRRRGVARRRRRSSHTRVVPVGWVSRPARQEDLPAGTFFS